MARQCRCKGAVCQLTADSARHGTATGYSNWGCRCEPCGEAQAGPADLYRARRKEAGAPCGCDGADCRLAPASARHGTTNGRTNWNCRCERCRAVGREDARRWRATSREDGPPCDCGGRLCRLTKRSKRHGTPGGHSNWGCRCVRCRAAHAAARRDYQRRRKARG